MSRRNASDIGEFVDRRHQLEDAIPPLTDEQKRAASLLAASCAATDGWADELCDVLDMLGLR